MDLTPDVLETPIVKRRLDYSRTGLWPPQPMSINPLGWLSNFDSEDRDIALSLLDSFIFYNEDMTLSLMRSAFSGMSARSEFRVDDNSWSNFLDDAIFTVPTGEIPSPTDSGYLLMRTVLRQKFRITQEHLLEPSNVVALLSAADFPRPIVFVDDFVGTGDQLLETLKREYLSSTGSLVSLEQLHQSRKISEVYVAAAIATDHSKTRIAEEYPYVRVISGHVIDQSHSAIAQNTTLVPEKFQNSLKPFIEKYSTRIGLNPLQAYGHGGQGYNLAFQHAIPDLTLPILWTETDKWTPLVRRQ